MSSVKKFNIVDSGEILDLNVQIDRGIAAAKIARRRCDELMYRINKLKLQNESMKAERDSEKERAARAEKLVEPLKDSVNRLTAERSKWAKKIKRLENKS